MPPSDARPIPNQDTATARGRSSWTDLRAEILRRISDGTYAPGTLIPTEQELAAEFGCARATVNRALSSLAGRGVLQRRRRIGTRVALNALGASSKRALPVFREAIESSGRRFDSSYRGRHDAPPSADVLALLFHSDPGRIVETRTLFYADGNLLCAERRWHDSAALPGLDIELPASTTINEWIATNVPISLIEQNVSARTAGDMQVETLLGCEPGAPVLVYETCVWAGTQPVSLARHAFLPGETLCTSIS